jgi:tetratricopeptide (TPR) repeat protein
MKRFRAQRGAWWLTCAIAVSVPACRANTSDSANTPTRPSANQEVADGRAVSLPDLAGADRAAEQQIRAAYATLMSRVDGGAPAADRARAYGDLGKLLMAAEFNDAAEPCFKNALGLAPEEWRWNYYLGHLSRRKGDLATSAAHFERTVAASPNNVAALWWLGTVYVDLGRPVNNVAALWWLGTVYVDLGRPVDAERDFSRALALQPGALSAVYGLGRAALARGDYAKAVEYLERVLAMNERAVAAHYPLGLAYRGLGKLDQAQAHLAQRTHMEILPIDPLMTELEELLQSVTAYQDRGMRAARSGNWDEAARQFQRAVEAAPDNVEARVDLAGALYRTGDRGGALTHAREAYRLAPTDPHAESLLKTLTSAR